MRRDGNTTRAVDRFVQEFFTKGITYIYDGRGSHSELQQTRHAFKMFKKRMFNEHKTVEYNHIYTIIDGILCYKVTKKE